MNRQPFASAPTRSRWPAWISCLAGLWIVAVGGDAAWGQAAVQRTTTFSSSRSEQVILSTATVRQDTFQTRIVGRANLGGFVVYDQTFALPYGAPQVQAAVGQQTRLRRTPRLRFEPDPVVDRAMSIEAALREVRNSDDSDHK